MSGRRYDRQQVEDILRRAVRSELDPDGIAHEDLVAAAGEVGIAPDALERAVAEVAAEELHAQLLAVVKAKRKRRFLRSLVSYLVVGFGALAVNRFSGGGQWAQWVFAGLALLALLRGIKAFLPTDSELERAVTAEERRQKRLAQRRQRRARAKAESTDARRREAEFERILSRGVDALLRVADQKLSHMESRPKGPRVRVEDTGADDPEGGPDRASRRRR